METLCSINYKGNDMKQEDYTPPSLTVSSVEELNQKLNEGLASIKNGQCIPAEVVNQRLHEKI